MLVNARGVVGALCLLPLAAATVLPQEAAPNQLIEINARGLERRAPPIVIGDGEESTSSRSTSSSSTASTPTPTTPTSTTTTPASTPTPTPTPTASVPTASTPTSTSTSRQVTQSAISTTDENGEPVTVFTTISVPNTPTPSATAPPSNNNSSSGPGTGTFIGLGVAGGIAIIGLVAFIVWKMNQKRFSQFDDEAGDINWPMPKEQLAPPAAPSTHAATNATSSSVDLTTRDPYAVPPLPAAAMPYYDDPSASGAYYDPYRGPVPQTFQSPPPSTEGHANAFAGEAIPMSTYNTSGRQSPGPNAMVGADPYGRSRSPGPAMAYDDPYASGRRSPGPSLAYGVPDPVGMRGGTPMGAPPRVGTPVGPGYGGVPPGLDIPRVGTPQGGGYAMGYGRASPAPPGAGYGPQTPLVDPYGRRTPGAYGP